MENEGLLVRARRISLEAYVATANASGGKILAPDELMVMLTRDLEMLGISPGRYADRPLLFQNPVCAYEGYSLDLSQRLLTKPDKTSVLLRSSIQVTILHTLITLGGIVVPYSLFFGNLNWPEDTNRSNLGGHILRIRRTIGDRYAGDNKYHYLIIKSAVGQGYIFDPPRLSE